MKKVILSAFATVAFGTVAIAGEKAKVVTTTQAAPCNCQPATKVVAVKAVTVKPVEVKVVKVETVKGYVVEDCGAAACERRTTRLRDRLATRRAPAPVVLVAEAPCADKAVGAKK